MTINRIFALAFALGLLALAWVGASFIGTNGLALAMTVLITAVYAAGAWELRQFRRTTGSLRQALEQADQTPASLPTWLEQVPAGLRNTVRLRIEGERVGLPGPSLAPYLVGLLVMLGMLGTFLGMVVTFKGAVFALQGSTDLNAIRGALAEPIRGLGLSFGTSVAGVAASAMLGLMSALARRERLDAARLLDNRVAGSLQPFSLAHHRQETLRAMQEQIRTLPEVAQALQGVMERIEKRSEQLDAQLLERHGRLHEEVTNAYADLARQVAATLRETVDANARVTGEVVRPIVGDAMAQVALEAQRTQQRLAEAAKEQTAALQAGVAQVIGQARELQQRVGDAAQVQAEALTATFTASERVRAEAESCWLQQHGERMDRLAQLWRTELGALRTQEDERVAMWRTELATLRAQESERGEAAVQRLGGLETAALQRLESLEVSAVQRLESLEVSAVQRLGELEAAVAKHLATLGAALEAPITRLLQTASEVPQAAAGVITQLREEMGRINARDNLALQERTLLLERLGTLVGSLEQASGDQRSAIEAMVASASSVLEQTHARFSQALQAQAEQSAQALATQAEQSVQAGVQATASAVELAAVADSFGESVRLFQASHDKLTDTLQRVEASLQKSTARSDEQLAYYVAQAREVIDLSIASQQGLVDSLRQLQGKGRTAAAAESVA
jgi:hypothetical protein